MNVPLVFGLLVDIGNCLENNTIPSKQSVDSLKPFYKINLIAKDYLVATQNLSDLELISLLKGITYVEAELGWSGGSVATGKYVFGCILRRKFKPETIDEISNWLLRNSKNHFWGPKDPIDNFYFG